LWQTIVESAANETNICRARFSAVRCAKWHLIYSTAAF
jgi:hypothetical protein